MRKLATIAVLMALVTAEAGAFAQAGPAGAPGVNQVGGSQTESRRRRDPAAIAIALAALTEFILVFAIAHHDKNHGRPASP
jgi:hypothetical protein